MNSARGDGAGRSRRRRAVRIGVTGPIGCGKSTICRWLGERLGVEVIDADQVARDVLDPGGPAYPAVVARFGIELVQDGGELDRAALARLVFSDPVALRDLEAIVHPAVRPRIRAAIAAAEASGAVAVVIEAIKLIEGGLSRDCDEVWLVTCDPVAQLDRLVGRGSSRQDAELRIAVQDGLAARVRALVTRAIDSSGSPAETRRAVEDALDAALAHRERPNRP